MPVPEDEGEPVAVTRVDGCVAVSVVQDVTSDGTEVEPGVSETEAEDGVAVSVAGVEVTGVSEPELGAQTVWDVVEVTDVVVKDVLV